MFSLQFLVIMCDPKCLVLGHSFVKRLCNDLEEQFDSRTKKDFQLKKLVVRLIGVGGRTIQKLRQHDLITVRHFRPDIVILELGTNDLTKCQPEVIGSQLEELVRELLNKFSVRVVGVCKVIPRACEDFNKKAKIFNRYILAWL